MSSTTVSDGQYITRDSISIPAGCSVDHELQNANDVNWTAVPTKLNRIIDALGCNRLPGKKTPAEYGALGSDKDGDPPQETFSYASIVGMLQYLHTHARPDLTLAVSQCSRFMHTTKRLHEIALFRIGQYLKLTRDKGLTLRPNKDLGIASYVDADFAGLWGFENPQDATSVKSRTGGYVLCISDCTVTWASRLQSDIALSTMEAVYNALSMALKELLPLKRLVETVAGAVQLPVQSKTLMRVTVWEDNVGALTLANLEPGRMMPRSKHQSISYGGDNSIVFHIKVKKAILMRGVQGFWGGVK